MALRDFFKPEWQHSDANIRMEAISRLKGPEAETILTELVKTDPSDSVRLCALEKLDPVEQRQLLEEMALTDRSKQVREAALDRLSPESLTRLAKSADDEYVRLDIVACRLDPNEAQTLLADIATNDTSGYVRIAAAQKLYALDALVTVAMTKTGGEASFDAVRRIDDPSALGTLARGAGDSAVRAQAISQLVAEENQPLLLSIATSDADWIVREAAVKQLDAGAHQEELACIAREDSDKNVRRAASAKLTKSSPRSSRIETRLVSLEVIEQLDFEKWQSLLADVAKHGGDIFVREAAVNNLDSALWQDLFAEIAGNDPVALVRRAAVMKLDHNRWQDLLTQISSSDRSSFVRKAAGLRLKFA